jgi:putative membrane protein
MSARPPVDSFDPTKITRPDGALMRYYLIVSLLTGPGFFVAILPLFFKYETLRYRFDDEGVSMSWGILFRREIYLTYRRIQDIHLTRNLLQRWLGLATVSVQTASGSAGPGMSIEGVLHADQLRDFLYAKMRGAREHEHAAESPAAVAGQPADDVLGLLHDIRDSLAQLVARQATKT